MKVVPNDNLNLAVKELGHVVVCAIWRDRKPRLYWQKYLQNAILPTVQPLLLLFSTQIFQLLNHVSYIWIALVTNRFLAAGMASYVQAFDWMEV